MSQSWLIASGKGGVGKSMLTSALGYALARRQMKTCCVDADLGLRDLDMLMNLHSQVVYDLVDVANRDCMLKSALIGCDEYLSLLPASQSAGHSDLDGAEFAKILGKLKKRYGYILTDAPAGIEHGLTNLIAPSDFCLVVTTPDDVAIRNAEQVIGVIEKYHKQRPLLVVNRVREDLLKKGLVYTPQVVAAQLDVPLLGYIPEDAQVIASLNTHENFMEKNCPAAKAVERICQRFLGQYVEMPLPSVRGWRRNKAAGKGGFSL